MLPLQIQSLALSFISSTSAERHISIVSQSHSYMTWTWEHCSTPDDPSEPTGKGKEQLPVRLEFTVARKRDGTWISHVRKLSTVVNSSLRWDAHISPSIQWVASAPLVSITIASHLFALWMSLCSFLKLALAYTWLLQRPVTICAQPVNNETLRQCLYFSLAATKSVVYPTWGTLATFQQALLRRLQWSDRKGLV